MDHAERKRLQWKWRSVRNEEMPAQLSQLRSPHGVCPQNHFPWRVCKAVASYHPADPTGGSNPMCNTSIPRPGRKGNKKV